MEFVHGLGATVRHEHQSRRASRASLLIRLEMVLTSDKTANLMHSTACQRISTTTAFPPHSKYREVKRFINTSKLVSVCAKFGHFRDAQNSKWRAK
eukprot:875300-Amphidinium_carterae.1